MHKMATELEVKSEKLAQRKICCNAKNLNLLSAQLNRPGFILGTFFKAGSIVSHRYEQFALFCWLGSRLSRQKNEAKIILLQFWSRVSRQTSCFCCFRFMSLHFPWNQIVLPIIQQMTQLGNSQIRRCPWYCPQMVLANKNLQSTKHNRTHLLFSLVPYL